MEDAQIVLERHEQQIRAIERDISDLKAVQTEIRTMNETLVTLANELKHTNQGVTPLVKDRVADLLLEVSDRLLHVGGDHHVFSYEAGEDVLHGRLEILHVLLDCRDDIVGSDVRSRDDRECGFQFLFDVIIIEIHGSLGIGKRNECECDGEYGNEKCVVDHNGDYATDNHEEDGGCTCDRKLTAFACLFKCISNAVELYCELTGFLFAFCRQYLISQCLFW